MAGMKRSKTITLTILTASTASVLAACHDTSIPPPSTLVMDVPANFSDVGACEKIHGSGSCVAPSVMTDGEHPRFRSMEECEAVFPGDCRPKFLTAENDFTFVDGGRISEANRSGGVYVYYHPNYISGVTHYYAPVYSGGHYTGGYVGGSLKAASAPAAKVAVVPGRIVPSTIGRGGFGVSAHGSVGG